MSNDTIGFLTVAALIALAFILTFGAFWINSHYATKLLIEQQKNRSTTCRPSAS